MCARPSRGDVSLWRELCVHRVLMVLGREVSMALRMWYGIGCWLFPMELECAAVLAVAHTGLLYS
jgi:hypothetical protein